MYKVVQANYFRTNLKIHVLQTRAAEKDAKTKIVSPSLTTPLNDGREAETFKDRFLR